MSFHKSIVKGMPEFLLVDNGSLRPDAFLNLERLADSLSSITGETVYAAPLLHAHKIDSSRLGGRRAVTLAARVKRLLKHGKSELVVVPLFFGPSGAITEYLPKRITELVEESRDPFKLYLLDELVGEDSAAVDAVGEILLEHFRSGLKHTGNAPAVVLVDHGSPKQEVCAVRDRLGEWLQARIGDQVSGFSVASMERRPGNAYAFNDPLLEELLQEGRYQDNPVMVLPLFLSPGRHAGPGGDIVGIAERILGERNGKPLHFAPLVGEHPNLLRMLAERIQHWRDRVRWASPDKSS